MPKFKIGDFDGNGLKISRIYQQGDRDNDFFVFYEDENKKFRYGARGYYTKKLIPLKNMLSELTTLTSRINSFELIRRNKDIRHRYNSAVANNISSFFTDADTTLLDERLIELKNKFQEEIQSLAKFNYLVQGSKVFGAFLLICLLFWFYESRLVYLSKWLLSFDINFLNFIYLATAGTAGAFISIIQKIGSLNVDKYLPDLRTRLDASIRIIIGAIFGNLLFWFSKAEFFSLINKEVLNFENFDNTLMSLCIAIIGGFGERLVPDILSNSTVMDNE